MSIGPTGQSFFAGFDELLARWAEKLFLLYFPTQGVARAVIVALSGLKTTKVISNCKLNHHDRKHDIKTGLLPEAYSLQFIGISLQSGKIALFL